MMNSVSLIKQMLQPLNKYFPHSIYKLAVTHYKNGDYSQAHDYFVQCLNEEGAYSIYAFDSEHRASCANYLANIYLSNKLGDRDVVKAAFFLQMSSELSNDPIHQRNVGGFFLTEGLVNNAMPYLIRCLESGYTKHFTAKHKAACAHYLGIAHVLKSSDYYNPHEAVEYHKLSIALDPTEPVYSQALIIAAGKVSAEHQGEL